MVALGVRRWHGYAKQWQIVKGTTSILTLKSDKEESHCKIRSSVIIVNGHTLQSQFMFWVRNVLANKVLAHLCICATDFFFSPLCIIIWILSHLQYLQCRRESACGTPPSFGWGICPSHTLALEPLRGYRFPRGFESRTCRFLRWVEQGIAISSIVCMLPFAMPNSHRS